MHPTSRPPQSHRSSCCWGRKTPLQHLAGASRSIWARLFQAAGGELAASPAPPGLSRCQFSFLFVNFFRSHNAGASSALQQSPPAGPSTSLSTGLRYRSLQEHLTENVKLGRLGWKTPRVITPCVGTGQERAPVGNGCLGRVQGAWGSL